MTMPGGGTLASTFVQVSGDWRIWRAEFQIEVEDRFRNLDPTISPRLDPSLFRRQFNMFHAAYLRDQTFNVHPNLDPNQMRILIAQMGMMGRLGGRATNQGFLSQFQNLPGLMGPIGIAVASAFAVSAVPLLGAAIVSGILLALGGGVIALGIASAVRDPAVKAAFQPLKQTAGVIFTEMGLQFRQPLIASLGIFRDALEESRPWISAIFGELSHVVEPLSRGLADMARNSL